MNRIALIKKLKYWISNDFDLIEEEVYLLQRTIELLSSDGETKGLEASL